MRCSNVKCTSPAAYYCGRCMKHGYCGDRCQRIDAAIHLSSTCKQFWWIAGSGDKRSRDATEEEMEQAAVEYQRLITIYLRSHDEKLVERLEALYGKLSKEKQLEYREQHPVHDQRDLFTFEELKDLEPTNVIYLFINNIKYGYDLDALLTWLRNPNHKLPPANVELTEQHRQILGDKIVERELEIWEQWRNTMDLVKLLELESKLLLYGYFMQKPQEVYIMAEKENRKRMYLEEIYANNDNWKRLWPILYEYLYLKMTDIDRNRLEFLNVDRDWIPEMPEEFKDLFPPAQWKATLHVFVQFHRQKGFKSEEWHPSRHLPIPLNDIHRWVSHGENVQEIMRQAFKQHMAEFMLPDVNFPCSMLSSPLDGSGPDDDNSELGVVGTLPERVKFTFKVFDWSVLVMIVNPVFRLCARKDNTDITLMEISLYAFVGDVDRIVLKKKIVDRFGQRDRYHCVQKYELLDIIYEDRIIVFDLESLFLSMAKFITARAKKPYEKYGFSLIIKE